MPDFDLLTAIQISGGKGMFRNLPGPRTEDLTRIGHPASVRNLEYSRTGTMDRAFIFRWVAGLFIL